MEELSGHCETVISSSLQVMEVSYIFKGFYHLINFHNLALLDIIVFYLSVGRGVVRKSTL